MKNYQRIILVDDDPLVMVICTHIVRKQMPWLEIVTLNSPAAALEYLTSEYRQPTVETIMLLDINMPLLSGWEVLDELIDMQEVIKKWISIYMFSSSIIIEDRELSATHPLVTGYLEKPLTTKKLADIVASTLSTINQA